MLFFEIQRCHSRLAGGALAPSLLEPDRHWRLGASWWSSSPPHSHSPFSSPRFGAESAEACRCHRDSRWRVLRSSHLRAACAFPLLLPAPVFSLHWHLDRTCAWWFAPRSRRVAPFPFRRPGKVRNVRLTRGAGAIACLACDCRSGCGFRWCVWDLRCRFVTRLWPSRNWLRRLLG